MSVFEKIKRGISSNIYAQVVTIATQLITLPIALTVWDLETYGSWIVLTAIPAYFGMAELGMGTATAGLAISALARKEEESARSYLSTANFMSGMICLAILLVSVLFMSSLAILGLVTRQSAVVVTLVATTNLLAVLMSVNEAAFRAADRYATGTVITTSGRLIEWGGFIVALVLHSSFIEVAVCMLLARAVVLIFQIGYLRLKVQALGWSCRFSGKDVARQIVLPALQLSVFPLVGLLSIQGMTIVVGNFYGSAIAGIFNAYRTYSRVSLQAITVISNPLLNWLTTGIARKEYVAVVSVYKTALRYSLITCVVLPVILFIGADFVFGAWTHGKISVDHGLMIAFLASAALVAMSSIPRSMLISANKPGELIGLMLAVAAIQLGLVALVAQYVPLVGVMLVVVVGDLILAIAAYRRAATVVQSFD